MRKDKRELFEITDFRQLVTEAASRYGNKLLYGSTNKNYPFEYTYNDMRDNVLYLGSYLIKMGIKDRKIAVIGEADPAYMTAYFASVISGNVIVPLDKELSEDQIVEFMNLAEVYAIFCMPSMNGTVTKNADRLTYTKLFISVTEDDIKPEGYLNYSEILNAGKDYYINVSKEINSIVQDTDRMCTLIFTSGTTGTSKGVMLSQKNLCSNAYAAAKGVRYYTDTVLMSVLPMNHCYESTTEHITLISLGCTTYLNDSLRHVMRNLKTVKPNSLILVPLFLETMHKNIFREIEKANMGKKIKFARSLSGILLKIGVDIRRKLFKKIIDGFGGELKYITCGGAKLDPEIVKDFKDFGIVINEGYGITECSPLLAVNRPGKEKIGSVGQPVDGCEVTIINKNENGIGEIAAKGPNIMLGYFNDTESTKSAFTEDGWFRTGDLGYLDDENYIFITGRLKNLIILSNGKNVYPEEIEEYLLKSEKIEEAVVLERDGKITAIIYPNFDLIENNNEIYDIIKREVDSINKELPTFKHIENIEIRETPFEKTTTQKIKRYVLK